MHEDWCVNIYISTFLILKQIRIPSTEQNLSGKFLQLNILIINHLFSNAFNNAGKFNTILFKKQYENLSIVESQY